MKQQMLYSSILVMLSLIASWLLLGMIQAANTGQHATLHAVTFSLLGVLLLQYGLGMWRSTALPLAQATCWYQQLTACSKRWMEHGARHWPHRPAQWLQQLHRLHGAHYARLDQGMVCVLVLLVLLIVQPLMALPAALTMGLIAMLPPKNPAKPSTADASTALERYQAGLYHHYHASQAQQNLQAYYTQARAASHRAHLQLMLTQLGVWSTLCVGVWLVWQGRLQETTLFLLTLLQWRAYAAAAHLQPLWHSWKHPMHTSKEKGEKDAAAPLEPAAPTAMKGSKKEGLAMADIALHQVPIMLDNAMIGTPLMLHLKPGHCYGIDAAHPRLLEWLRATMMGEHIPAQGYVQVGGIDTREHPPHQLQMLCDADDLQQPTRPHAVLFYDLQPPFTPLHEALAQHVAQHHTHTQLLVLHDASWRIYCQHIITLSHDGTVKWADGEGRTESDTQNVKDSTHAPQN